MRLSLLVSAIALSSCAPALLTGCGETVTAQVQGGTISANGNVSFLQGRKFGVLGDSISSIFNNAWQNVVIARTGMALAIQDARPDRSFATAFECWGNPAVGAQVRSYNPNYALPGGMPCSQETTGITAGSTLSQALANVDVEIVELGTNDQAFPLGQLGDSASAGTYYGNMRWVVEALLSAKPALRVILVTPQYNVNAAPANIQRYADATEAYGKSMGVPVINMFEKGGVNSINAAVLLRDGTHPSDFGFRNFYGPVIAQGLQQLF